MAAKRTIYTAEFKREAVSLSTHHGYGVSEAARNLGLHATRLRKWKRTLEQQGAHAFPGNGRLSPEQEELHRLRQENKRLRMEREILKQAAFCLPTRRVDVGVSCREPIALAGVGVVGGEAGESQ